MSSVRGGHALCSEAATVFFTFNLRIWRGEGGLATSVLQEAEIST